MNDLEYTHVLEKIDHLLDGRIDFVEAGDCRIPGLAESLRVSLSGDPEKPLMIYNAAVPPKVDSPDVKKATKLEALQALVLRQSEIEKTKGPLSRVFTVKLRKQYSW